MVNAIHHYDLLFFFFFEEKFFSVKFQKLDIQEILLGFTTLIFYFKNIFNPN